MPLPFPHGIGSGQIGNNADINTSDTPGSTGGRFIGFGEEGTSAIANRAHWALSSNDDYLYGKVTRDIAVGSGAAFTSSSQSTYHLTGDVFCGDDTYPGTPGTYDDDYAEGMLLLFSVLDDKYNELTDALGNEVRVAVVRDTTNAVDMYKGGTVPPPGYVGFVTNPWVTFRTVDASGAEVQNPYTIPVSQKVRLLFGIKSTLEALPRDALTRYHLNAADEAPAGVVLQDGTRKMTGSFLPYTNGTLTLGDASHQWADLYINGPLHIGASATITGDLIPTSSTHDLGSSGTRWDDLFVKKISAVASSGNDTAITATGYGSGRGVTAKGGDSGYGVYGQGGDLGSNEGVYGLGGTPGGSGVKGQGVGSGYGVKGLGAVGSSATGVHGEGGSVDGYGVVGQGHGTGYGVYGSGGGSCPAGVYGQSGSNKGVHGRGSPGVYGEGYSAGLSGVSGLGLGTGGGVIGTGGNTDGSVGVYGTSSATNGVGVQGVGTGTGVGVVGTSFALDADASIVIPIPLNFGLGSRADGTTPSPWFMGNDWIWKVNTSIAKRLHLACMLPHGFRPETLHLHWYVDHGDGPDTPMYAVCYVVRHTPSSSPTTFTLNAAINCTKVADGWDSGSLTGTTDHRIDFTSSYGDWLVVDILSGAHAAGAIDYLVLEVGIVGKISAPGCYHAGRHVT